MTAGARPCRPLVVAAVAVAAATVDLATKSAAARWLDDRTVEVAFGLVLRESRNPGAAFSLATDRTLLLSLAAAAVLVFIAVHARGVRSRPYAVGLGLVAGGAAGNLVDRVFRAPGPLRGAVVDWIDFGWFPSFNLADTAITLGAALLVLLSLPAPSDAPPAQPSADA